MIYYEWVIEAVDEHGDIQDVTHADTFREALDIATSMEGDRVDIALVRNVIDNYDEDLKDRQWAYLKGGVLPEVFDGGARMPKRFLHETLRSAEDK